MSWSKSRKVRGWDYSSQSSGTNPPTVTNVERTATVVDSFNGVNNPHWQQQIKAVLQAGTPATGTFRDFQLTPFVAVVKGWTTTPYYVGSPSWRDHTKTGYYAAFDAITSTSIPSISGSLVSRADNQAIERLYDRLRAFVSPANAGEDIGEIGQTISMLRRPLSGLQTLVSKTVNGHLKALNNYNRTKQLAKSLADVALEYRFGIKPLISTLAEAYVALENREQSFYYKPFSVYGKADSASSGSNLNCAVTGVANVKMSSRSKSSATVRYKGMFAARVDHDLRSVSQSLGLTWREMVPTLYNLIPYSFLADYVSNLGTFANSFAVPWQDVRWCIRSRRCVNEEIRLPDFVSNTSAPSFVYHTRTMKPGRVSCTVTNIDRAVIDKMPFPSFQFEIPSARQAVNVVALLASKLPIVGQLTKKAASNDRYLDRELRAAVRDRGLKVPYPFH